MLKLKAIEAPHNEWLANELAAGGKAEVFVCTKAKLDKLDDEEAAEGEKPDVLGTGKFHLVRRPKFTMISLDAACTIPEEEKGNDQADPPTEDKATEFVAKTVDAETDNRLFVKLTQEVTRTVRVFEANPQVDFKLEGAKSVATVGNADITWAQVEAEDSTQDAKKYKPGVFAVEADSSLYHHGVLVVTVKVTVDAGILVAADPNVSHTLRWAPGVSYLDAVAPLAGAPCTKLDRPVFTVRGANDHHAQCWKRMGDWSPIYVPFE